MRFPTCSLSLSQEEKRRRSVQFNDSVEVKSLEQDDHQLQQQRQQQQAALGPVQIDEGKIDNVGFAQKKKKLYI